MNYTLSELWALFEAQENTPAKYIKEQFNNLTKLGVKEMTDLESEGISYVITNRLSRLMKCKTIYTNADMGVESIKSILKYNLFSLVVEIRNISKAIEGEIATTHVRNKFNPIDNDNIKDAPTRTDDESFTEVANMISQVEYLKDNSRTLDNLYSDFTNICYILGV